MSTRINQQVNCEIDESPGRLICLTLPAHPEPAIAIAASRAGAIGVLDLEYTDEIDPALEAVSKLASSGKPGCGVKIDLSSEDFASAVLAQLPSAITTVVIARPEMDKLPELISGLQRAGRRVLVEATDAFIAAAAARYRADGIILKGNEAGGRVGQESAFILFQRCIDRIAVPLWVQGGIGPHTASACVAAGAAGVVLDWQLALTNESPLPRSLKDRLALMDGSETTTTGAVQFGDTYRIYAQPRPSGLRATVAEFQHGGGAASRDGNRQRWRELVMQSGGSESQGTLLLSQDVAFAAALAKQHRTVGGIVRAIAKDIPAQIRTAQNDRALDEHGPLAASHGTQYPILQGPMTRVSDVPEFCEAVGDGGALPFLALALMRAPRVDALLQATGERMRTRPWGVGILGFVPLDLRQEQLEIVLKHRPPFAIIAGGRPDQAARLEENGIATYLHVPSPGLLKLFIESGARRFIFEGRECGGHVGPRSSFVLWQSMVDLIVGRIDAGQLQGPDCHVVFAGGIHDARSAAMVAVIAAPLTSRGVKIGVLMGTAYLFTEEAVATGAITRTFQLEALQSDHTVLVETGPGHAIRCFDTPFVATFEREKERLLAGNHSHDEAQAALENLNLGRLRIASKGIKRDPGSDPASQRFVEVPSQEQRSEGMYMSGQLAALRERVTTIADLHREVAVNGSAFLNSVRAPEAKQTTPSRPCDIAIIGMSTLLPKAPTLQQYWENIVNKVDAIEEIPKDRWDCSEYFEPERTKKDRIYSKWGGFLDPISFDPVLYGMPPNSVRSIEPAQLLTLHVAQASLADAGYSARQFDREHTSIILGAGGGAADIGQLYGFRATLPMFFGEHADRIVDQLGNGLPEWSEDSFAGILTNVAAGRAANRLDLGGCNFTVDAACASSLAAVYLGVRELESGTSNMVLVGGVDTMQGPFAYMAFSKTQALSPRGRCRTFDETADGIAISEGLAMLVLKRREDAERDGDRIYAVIRGVGSSSDGRDKGLTAPRPEGQVRALERAYGRAGISPGSVGLIEAHGTGTVAGDRAEVSALSTFFSRHGAEIQKCAIGSVKSMIGHTKCTAGVAGLIKVALALHERVLPPTIGVQKPSSHINFTETPFYINSEARPWIGAAPDSPRRAGVSAFGFGGTNFHLVVEEYAGNVTAEQTSVMRNWPTELFIWAASDRAGLLAAVGPVEKLLSAGATPPLADLAFTICSASESVAKNAGVRLAIVANSLNDLSKKLATARHLLGDPNRREIVDRTGIFFSERPLARDGRLAFLFPGQGSQYPNMGLDVTLRFPEARAVYERADRELVDRYKRPLSTWIYPPPTFDEEAASANRKALTDTHVAQPALGAMAMASVSVLKSLGVIPEMVAGHSYGEFAALWAAGLFDDKTLLRLSEARGRFMRDCAGSEPGTMAAVEADAASVTSILERLTGVVCANANAPKQTVIAGPADRVEDAIKTFAAEGIGARRLPVACAFHSPLVAGAREHLAAVLAGVPAQHPAIPVYSNTTGARHDQDPTNVIALLANHLARPVEFVHEIEAMYADGARVFLEVGAKSVLTGLVGQILAGRPHTAIAIDQEGRPALYQLQLALAQLAAEGVAIATDRLFSARDVRRLDMNALHGVASPAYSPTTWLVNGTRSIPVRDIGKPLPSLRVNLKDLVSANGDTAAVPASTAGEHNGVAKSFSNTEGTALKTAANSHTPTPQHPDAIDSAATSTSGTGLAPSLPAALKAAGGPVNHVRPEAASVLTQFQQVMSRFLETQQAVMLAYLNNVNGVTSVPAQRPTPIPASTHTPIGKPVTPPPAPAPVQPALASTSPALEPAPVAPAVPAVKLAAAGVAQAASAPAISRETLTAQLVAIVVERTGYPPEMLGLDLDLEADLGVDSIKRVEILGTFRGQIGAGSALSESAMEELSRIKTLRGIVEWAVSHAAGGSPPSPGKATPPRSIPAPSTVEAQHASENSGIQRARVKIVPAPAPDRAAGLARGGVVLITDDGSGIAADLGQRLGMGGITVARVKLGSDVNEIAPGVYTCDFTSSEAVQQLAKTITSKHGGVAGIIHLLPLRSVPELDAFTLPAWRERLAEDVGGLFHLARSLSEPLHAAAASGGAAVLVVSRMGGAFGFGGSPQFFAGNGGIAGLAKTLSLEWPDVRVRAVDVDGSSVDVVSNLVEQELYSRGPEVEIAYRAGKRYSVAVESAPLASGHEQIRIDSQSVILLTGGARGVTAEVAEHLARRYRPTLLLTGRSPQPPADEHADTASLEAQQLKGAIVARMRHEGRTLVPAQVEQEYRRIIQEREMRATLRSIEAAGAKVRYFQVDMREEDAVREFLDTVYRDYGRLDGVVHGAGVIEDKLIEQKDPASFTRVFGTKADSAFLLARLLRFDQLRFLVFFSSVSGRFGNRGQGDYAAANEVLNKLASQLAATTPARVVAINWGPWAGSGMVSPELERRFAERGVVLIPRDVGAHMFEQEVLFGPKSDSEVVITGGGWTATHGANVGVLSPEQEDVNRTPEPRAARAANAYHDSAAPSEEIDSARREEIHQ